MFSAVNLADDSGSKIAGIQALTGVLPFSGFELLVGHPDSR